MIVQCGGSSRMSVRVRPFSSVEPCPRLGRRYDDAEVEMRLDTGRHRQEEPSERDEEAKGDSPELRQPAKVDSPAEDDERGPSWRGHASQILVILTLLAQAVELMERLTGLFR